MTSYLQVQIGIFNEDEQILPFTNSEGALLSKTEIRYEPIWVCKGPTVGLHPTKVVIRSHDGEFLGSTQVEEWYTKRISENRYKRGDILSFPFTMKIPSPPSSPDSD